MRLTHVLGALIVFALAACGDDSGPSVTTSGCRLNSDCPVGEACEDGSCVETECMWPACVCSSDTECPRGLACDVASGTCLAPACDVDLDCRLGERCAGGTCVVDVEADRDADGVPDGSVEQPRDNCPEIANTEQEDLDGDGVGNACDDDGDGDLVANALDNCQLVANSGQEDADGDGAGNLCDDDWRGVTIRGVITVHPAGPSLAAAELTLIGPEAREGVISGNDDGSFRFDEWVHVAGQYSVRVEWPGLVRSTQLFYVGLDNPLPDPVELDVYIDGSAENTAVALEGRVRLRDQVDHAGTVVSIRRAPGGELFGVTQTNSDGTFRAVAFSFESYRLTFEHDGWLAPGSVGDRIYSFEGEPESGTFVDDLDRAPIDVILEPAGDGGSVEVSVELAPEIDWLPPTGTLADVEVLSRTGTSLAVANVGQAPRTLSGLPVGRVIVRASLPGFTIAEREVDVLPSAEPVNSVTLTLALRDLAAARFDLSEVVFDCVRIAELSSLGVNVAGTDFDGARMVGDMTVTAIDPGLFQGVSFSGADLSGWEPGSWPGGADNAGLCGTVTSFAGFDLSRVDFSRATALGTVFLGADLSSADLSQANLRDAVFGDGVVLPAALLGSTFTRADLTNASMIGVDLPGAELGSTVLLGTRFDDANLEGAYMNLSDLSGATFDGAFLIGAQLINSVLVGTSLRGADLSGAKLNSAVIDGADFTCRDVVEFPDDATNDALDPSNPSIVLNRVYADLELDPTAGDVVDYFPFQIATPSEVRVAIDHHSPFKSIRDGDDPVDWPPFFDARVAIVHLDVNNSEVVDSKTEPLLDDLLTFMAGQGATGLEDKIFAFAAYAQLDPGQYYVRVSSTCFDSCGVLPYHIAASEVGSEPTGCQERTALAGAFFDGASVQRSRFDMADLSGASFVGTSFLGELDGDQTVGVRALGASFDGANFSASVLNRADFSFANLQGAEFPGAILSGSTFPGANLDGADFSQGVLSGVLLASTSAEGATFVNADLTGAQILASRWSNANFDNANMGGISALATEFEDASFRGARLYNARLEVSDFFGGTDCDAGCGAGEVCIDDLCTTACNTDNQCESGEVCEPDERGCVVSFDGCHADRVAPNADFAFADLRGARLQLADLRRANFYASSLDGADIDNAQAQQMCFVFSSLEDGGFGGSGFTRSSFEGSSLRGSEISGDFSKCNLAETDFSRSDSRECNFSGATSSPVVDPCAGCFRAPRFDDALIERSDLSGVSFAEASFVGATISETTAYRADLTRADFSGATIRNAVDFSGATLTGATFRGARIGGGGGESPVMLHEADMSWTEFNEASLTSVEANNTDFTHADFSSSLVQDAKLQCANLMGATIWRADFIDNEYEGASLLAARFETVEYGHSAMLDGTVCPNGVVAPPQDPWDPPALCTEVDYSQTPIFDTSPMSFNVDPIGPISRPKTCVMQDPSPGVYGTWSLLNWSGARIEFDAVTANISAPSIHAFRGGGEGTRPACRPSRVALDGPPDGFDPAHFERNCVDASNASGGNAVLTGYQLDPGEAVILVVAADSLANNRLDITFR